MKLEKVKNNVRYTFTNEGLKGGDLVWPLIEGRLTDDGYIMHNTRWGEFDLKDPHIIQNIRHSDERSHEVRTDKGYSPIEVYFKIIKKEVQVEQPGKFSRKVWTVIPTILLIMLLSWVTSYSQIGYINCSPFPSKCLIVATDYDQAKAWLAEDTLWGNSIATLQEDFAGDYSFTTYIDKTDSYPMFIIVFDEPPTNDLEGYLTVGHELTHLIQFLYASYGVDFITEAEFTAYFFEYFVNETFKIINK